MTIVGSKQKHRASVSLPGRKLGLQTGSVPSPCSLRPLAIALIELAMTLIKEDKSK